MGLRRIDSLAWASRSAVPVIRVSRLPETLPLPNVPLAMLLCRPATFWHQLPRRICTSVTLVCYLVAAFGMPLPMARAHNDTAPSGSCQDNACGCPTVEQCQTSCCCPTPKSAGELPPKDHGQPAKPKRHNVRRAKTTPTVQEKPLATKPSCCNPEGPGSSECAAGHCPFCAQESPSCCQKTQPSSPNPKEQPTPTVPEQDDQEEQDEQPAPDASEQDARDTSREGRWRLGVSALKCQGHSTLWVTAGVVLPCPWTENWTLSPAPTLWLSWTDEIAHTLPLLPHDPPPRSSHR